MGLKMRFSWRNRRPVAEASAGFHLVARFLEGEIQGSLRQGCELLDIIADLIGKRRMLYTETGNALTIIMTSERVALTSEVNEGMLNLDLGDFREALAGWLVFLAKGRS